MEEKWVTANDTKSRPEHGLIEPIVLPAFKAAVKYCGVCPRRNSCQSVAPRPVDIPCRCMTKKHPKGFRKRNYIKAGRLMRNRIEPSGKIDHLMDGAKYAMKPLSIKDLEFLQAAKGPTRENINRVFGVKL